MYKNINEIYKKSTLFLVSAGALLLCCFLWSAAAAQDWSGLGTAFDSSLIKRIDPIAEGIVRVECENGITARLYSPAYLMERIAISAAGSVLTLNDGERIAMITDIADPRIYNKGDGVFHPFEANDVIRALGEIECAGMEMEIDVYLLPVPRCELLSSSTRGRDIFLSPQVRELSFEGAAFIVTHESGHAFQNRFLPLGDNARWNEYKRLRGIEDETIFNANAEHACRPVEIFAEDFRVLFGGAAARYDGRVENADLPAPDQIAGLDAFYLALTDEAPADGAIARVDNYPNPFNPATDVWITLSDAYELSRDRLTVRVYDVAGSLVRELFSGVADGRELRLAWDGRDARGASVASAAYFCLVRAGEETVTRKLLLVK